MQTISPRLLIVDHDGKIVHRLMWDAGQYVFEEEVIEASLVSQDASQEVPAVAPAAVAAQASRDTQQIIAVQDTPATVPSQDKLPEVPTADDILRQLKRLYEPLQDAVIVAADGAVLAATSDVASAMMREVVTALVEFSTQASQALDLGTITEITSRDAQMLSILYPASNGMALGVTTASNGNLGLLYRICQGAVQRLSVQP
jgi:predicted regulator of Ras-like GTPase activity (Roadblock/LC7/MglB family)